MPSSPDLIAQHLAVELAAVSARTPRAPTLTPHPASSCSPHFNAPARTPAGPTPPRSLRPDLESSVGASKGDGHFLASPCDTTAPRVGLDALDELVLRMLPPGVRQVAEKTLTDVTTALATEGAGPTLRRALAREVAICRAELRLVQGLRNRALTRFASGEVDEHRLLVLERVLNAEHKRWMNSIEALTRASGAAATIRVSAHNVAVVGANR